MDDKRLERLYDYTKFHIGIYLSAAGGLAALMSTAAAGASQRGYISSLVGAPWALGISFLLLFLAGVSGAIVATSAIKSTSYDEFVTSYQGAYGVEPFRGQHWVTFEHACFWLSLAFLAGGIFSSDRIACWLGIP